MFEFAKLIHIEAPPGRAWQYVADVEGWWLASNLEQIRMSVSGEGVALGVGTEITFEKSVAGLEGQAEGRITRLVPGNLIEWEGRARYRYLGFPLQVCLDELPARALVDEGHTNVMELDGGFGAWKAQDREFLDRR